VSEAAPSDAVLRRVLWSLPTGLYVLGSVEEVGSGPWNLMTINLVTQVATSPRVVMLSVEREAVTARYAAASGALALSILSRQDRAVVRRFVKPVQETELGADGVPITMAGQAVHLAPGGAPVLDGAVAWIDLWVVDRRDFESHVALFAEVSDAGAIDALLEGSASERRVDVLRMEDTKMSYGG
jgi:flavin reductase (DIM6/NTAB) family NADH-FMN oxidoreductase RutF